jgi:predicted CoA-binding protein
MEERSQNVETLNVSILVKQDISYKFIFFTLQMFISKSYTYALLGASTNPEKYGNIILTDFSNAGYHILPINPHTEQVNGIKAYKNLTEIPEPIDVVITVVQPEILISLLPLVKEKGIPKVRMQTGSASPEAVKFCEDNGIEYVNDRCIMVERRKREEEEI